MQDEVRTLPSFTNVIVSFAFLPAMSASMTVISATMGQSHNISLCAKGNDGVRTCFCEDVRRVSQPYPSLLNDLQINVFCASSLGLLWTCYVLVCAYHSQRTLLRQPAG